MVGGCALVGGGGGDHVDVGLQEVHVMYVFLLQKIKVSIHVDFMGSYWTHTCRPITFTCTFYVYYANSLLNIHVA